MGYAAGVGKTYKMLEEAHVLKAQGVDIVVGYFEPHGRQETIAKAKGLDAIPRKKLDYRGASFEEMDTESILARHPQVCLVDELPHTNVPGSARNKRWEDVAVLLNAGIDILTTMNIQHLESLNDQVRNRRSVLCRTFSASLHWWRFANSHCVRPRMKWSAGLQAEKQAPRWR